MLLSVPARYGRCRRPSVLRILVAVGAVVGVAALILAVRVVPQFKRAGVAPLPMVVAEIRGAVLSWQREHPGRCPKLEELISDRWLDAEFGTEACHGPYTIQCTGNDVVVSCTEPEQR
ncbi:MAG: hypothetical protein JW940_32610 [Polyangiaceae bacterium]|nr:hypothetical protein [Polyangiaceae bacterium]